MLNSVTTRPPWLQESDTGFGPDIFGATVRKEIESRTNSGPVRFILERFAVAAEGPDREMFLGPCYANCQLARRGGQAEAIDETVRIWAMVQGSDEFDHPAYRNPLRPWRDMLHPLAHKILWNPHGKRWHVVSPFGYDPSAQTPPETLQHAYGLWFGQQLMRQHQEPFRNLQAWLDGGHVSLEEMRLLVAWKAALETGVIRPAEITDRRASRIRWLGHSPTPGRDPRDLLDEVRDQCQQQGSTVLQIALGIETLVYAFWSGPNAGQMAVGITDQ